ncbi:vWA domain-containing protein [Rubellimicrobium arenae]|uniref:vWA domain-containing protein n=1 Tax=Rubellimicrobium arenae TaxID=2817372 RepID=UPI001B3033B3|nr:vWA domain-containing protein [Rubellimicrobium arenae]
MKNLFRGFASLMLAFTASSALADSIDPAAYSGTLDVGESVTIEKTVTVSAGRPDSARLDVMFVVDTTGSMGGVISDVRSNANSILSTLSGFGDVNFGVVDYKDVSDSTPYRLATALTSDTAAVQAGINSLSPGGGGDLPEFNFGGLEITADSTAWREGSTRVIVWFGDAPGADRDYLGDAYTEASATGALEDKGIIVHAVNVGTTGTGLDEGGQATRITDATGGEIFGVSGDGTGVSEAIIDAIDTTFDDYSTVDLAVTGDSSCVSVSTSPGYSGSYDRSVDRDFTFEVTFTGTSEGSCAFNIDALVDGGAIASEADSFVVGDDDTPAPIPLPATLPLLLSALGAGLVLRNRWF